MKAFIKSWQFMAIIAVVLTLVVVGLLVFGITTHEEAGLMEGAPNWDRGVPIGVCSYSYTDTDADNALAHAAVAHAIDVTNERLGFEVFSIHPTFVDHCYVPVTVGVPAESGWTDPGGVAEFPDTGQSCEIRTANTGTDELLSLTLQHELGHCLGLAHDDFELSIMWPVQTPTPDGQFPPRITDSDRALLIERYGPR